MFGVGKMTFFRNKRLNKYTLKAQEYLSLNYTDSNIPHAGPSCENNNGIRYSERDQVDRFDEQSGARDFYSATNITDILRDSSIADNPMLVLQYLNRNINQTFVDRLLYYINKKGMRDSAVYKEAQVDKRLFSKIASNREYKPSKDTAIALALALELSLDEVNDLLSRAGYTFSHSNKRDIIIEFFFREKIYKLIDVNEILYRLDQKPLGRS